MIFIFEVWLASFSVMSSKSIQSPVDDLISFFLNAELNRTPIMYGYPIFFIPSPVY